MESFVAINQNKTNTMSDNYQQLWDLKYFHLQDTCRDWGGWRGGEEMGLFDYSLQHSPLKKIKLPEKEYAAF